MVHREIKNNYYQKKRKTTTAKKQKISVKKIDLIDMYTFLHLDCIHRHFRGNDTSLLAIFSVFEFLHNFHSLLENFNKLPKIKEMNFSGVFDWYEWNIKSLEDGKIGVRPEVWNYVLKNKMFPNTTRKKYEKQAAQEALNILSSHKGILSIIKHIINEYKTVMEKNNQPFDHSIPKKSGSGVSSVMVDLKNDLI